MWQVVEMRNGFEEGAKFVVQGRDIRAVIKVLQQEYTVVDYERIYGMKNPSYTIYCRELPEGTVFQAYKYN